MQLKKCQDTTSTWRGMAIENRRPNYILETQTASKGLVVVGVEFRNTAGILGKQNLGSMIVFGKWVYENKN